MATVVVCSKRRVDLSAYAGQRVDVKVSYVTDATDGGVAGGIGVCVDDTRLTAGDTVVEADGFEADGAHHDPRSFCYGVLERFTAGLSDAGHTSDVVDLYAIRFDPVLADRDVLPSGHSARGQLRRRTAVLAGAAFSAR